MQTKELQLYKKIDTLLWEEWDPIGVNDYGGPDDEYRSYVPKVFRMKTEGASTIEIAQELFIYEKVDMGLHANKERCEKIADKIIAL